MYEAGVMSGIAAFVMQAGSPAAAVLGFIVGALLGLIHFGTLWWNTQAYTSGGNPFRALAVQILRFALLGIVFVGIAKLGAFPLLAGALGLLVSRGLLLRRLGGV
jgi:F1F0 ATPase subunit 2